MDKFSVKPGHLVKLFSLVAFISGYSDGGVCAPCKYLARSCSASFF